jgi:hypothetical protein
MTSEDGFELIRAAETSAPNYDLDTEDILKTLAQWKELCSFRVTEADDDTIEIEFTTLPADMTAFVKDLYEFCPDLVDQGTGCVQEMLEEIDDPSEIPDNLRDLIEGVDFEDEDYGLEILKREIQANKTVSLWWD